MAKTIKDLDFKVNELKSHFNEELGKFKNEISKVKSPIGSLDDGDIIGSLNIKFDFFKSEMENRLKNLETQISALRSDSDSIQLKMDNFIQQSNKSKLLLLGCKETPGENNLNNELVKIINSRIKVNIKNSDIHDCYRIGRKTDKNSRPVIIELCNVTKRNEIFDNKKLLKGTGLVVAEVLSPIRNNTYKLIRQKMGPRACWTNRGRIGFKSGATVKYVTTIEQFYSALSESTTTDKDSNNSTSTNSGLSSAVPDGNSSI